MAATDSNHLFLLSLASLSVVVGCGDGLPGGVAPSEPINTDNKNALGGGGNGGQGPGGTTQTGVCERFAANYIQCTGGGGPVGAGSYASSGYQDAGPGYSVDYADEDELARECEEIIGYGALGGPACSAAVANGYACIAALDCQAFQSDEFCRNEFTQVDLACGGSREPEGEPSPSPDSSGGGGSGSGDTSG